MTEPCPHCHGEGVIKTFYIWPDLYIYTACTCEAGQAFKAQIAAMTTEILEDENDHHN